MTFSISIINSPIKIILMFLICILSFSVKSQRIFVSDYTGTMFEYKAVGGKLEYVDSFSLYSNGERLSIFSCCLRKDTLYIITERPPFGIFRHVLGVGKEAVFLPGSALNRSANSMTISRDGIIYIADHNLFINNRNVFYKYDTKTQFFTTLNDLNYSPEGDLIFYKDKLLFSSRSFIVEVNLENPSQSTEYMETKDYRFYGLISIPKNCNENYIYGVQPTYSSPLIELDLENKKIIGEGPYISTSAYDGASSVDNGGVSGARIDSLLIKGICNTNTPIDLNVIASSASSENILYNLTGYQQNNNGIFKNLKYGTYQLKLTTTNGCQTDTSVVVQPVEISLAASLSASSSCTNPDGTLTLLGKSNYQPLLYSINNGSYLPTSQHRGLASGYYFVQMRNSVGCIIADTFKIGNIFWNGKITGIQTQQANCNTENGKIEISLSPGTTNITTSINDGLKSPTLVYSSLPSGLHKVSLFYENSCRFDTLINIAPLLSAKPVWKISPVNENCFDSNNGQLKIELNADSSKFRTSINGSLLSSTFLYQKLQPGKYKIELMDEFGCSWVDSSFIVKYNKPRATINWKTINPNCDNINGGSISFFALGGTAPYILEDSIRGKYPISYIFKELKEGHYSFKVLNADGCEESKLKVSLVFDNIGKCDFFYVPTAFTPNGDGLNEKIKPLYSPLFSNVRFLIYNRFGQILYEYKPNSIGWDGKHKGLEQPSGAYVWSAIYVDALGQNRQMKGSVVLIR